MTDIIKKINWKELLFPIWRDIQSLNEATNTIENNWELANNPAEYKEVLSKIKENSKSDTEEGETFIVLQKKAE